jgi:hypothetical protein
MRDTWELIKRTTVKSLDKNTNGYKAYYTSPRGILLNWAAMTGLSGSALGFGAWKLSGMLYDEISKEDPAYLLLANSTNSSLVPEYHYQHLHLKTVPYQIHEHSYYPSIVVGAGTTLMLVFPYVFCAIASFPRHLQQSRTDMLNERQIAATALQQQLDAAAAIEKRKQNAEDYKNDPEFFLPGMKASILAGDVEISVLTQLGLTPNYISLKNIPEDLSSLDDGNRRYIIAHVGGASVTNENEDTFRLRQTGTLAIAISNDDLIKILDEFKKLEKEILPFNHANLKDMINRDLLSVGGKPAKIGGQEEKAPQITKNSDKKWTEKSDIIVNISDSESSSERESSRRMSSAPVGSSRDMTF